MRDGARRDARDARDAGSTVDGARRDATRGPAERRPERRASSGTELAKRGERAVTDPAREDV
ncbi:hypothetical protein [Sorangium sp. So ce385]|uniref:hypothetical protein n=1 Tax=Sorangium sp. So ce385 TaxID=3133308 RepID=UPI003F5BCA6B